MEPQWFVAVQVPSSDFEKVLVPVPTPVPAPFPDPDKFSSVFQNQKTAQNHAFSLSFCWFRIQIWFRIRIQIRNRNAYRFRQGKKLRFLRFWFRFRVQLRSLIGSQTFFSSRWRGIVSTSFTCSSTYQLPAASSFRIQGLFCLNFFFYHHLPSRYRYIKVDPVPDSNQAKLLSKNLFG